MHALGEGLSQPVAQRLDHDRRIIVVLGFKRLGPLLHFIPSRHGKAAEIVSKPSFLRCDEISEGEIGAVPALALHLLAQGMNGTQHARAPVIRIELDVIAHRIGRPEPDDRARLEPAFAHDPLQHGLRIVEQARRRLAHNVIIQDLRILARKVPGAEERRPVYAAHQLAEIVVVKHAGAGEGRLRRLIAVPGDRRLVGTRLCNRECFGLRPAGRMFLPHLRIVVGDLLGIGLLRRLRQKVGSNAHSAAGIGDINHRVLIIRRDFHRRMHLGGCRPADQQRNVEFLPLHLGGHVAHLIQRRGDQARQADDVHLMLPGFLEDCLRRHHHAEIDHLVIVTLQHHADDVLADVMHIALHRRHQDLALGLALAGAFLLRFDERNEMGHGLLHHAGGLHHLRQEHLARTEQVAHHVHAVHQRPFDHVQRPLGLEPGFLGVFHHIVGNAVHQRVRQPLLHGAFTPAQVLDLRSRAAALVFVRDFQQPVRRVLAAVEDHVLNELPKLRGNFVINDEGRRVDDAHIHTRRNGVIEEHRVHRLAHRIIAAERE